MEINEIKSCFFEKINKSDKFQVKLFKEKGLEGKERKRESKQNKLLVLQMRKGTSLQFLQTLKYDNENF